MFATIVIAFREGTEAFLIVAVAVAYLRRSGKTALLRPLWSGVSVALAISLMLGVALANLGGLGALWEARLALVAAVLVLTCTSTLLRRGSALKAAIAANLESAAIRPGATAKIGVFLFAFLMIGREGSEAAAMVAAVAGQTGGLTLAIGGIGGLLLAAILAQAWVRYGRQVDLALFFKATAVFVALFSVQLCIYALHEFAEASALPLIDNAAWHIATEPFGPDGAWGRLISYSLVLAPALLIGWTRLMRLNDSRHPRASSPETPSMTKRCKGG